MKKTRTKLIGALLALFMLTGLLPLGLLTARAESYTGTGSASDPYVVTEWEDLVSILAKNSEKHIKLGTSITHAMIDMYPLQVNGSATNLDLNGKILTLTTNIKGQNELLTVADGSKLFLYDTTKSGSLVFSCYLSGDGGKRGIVLGNGSTLVLDGAKVQMNAIDSYSTSGIYTCVYTERNGITHVQNGGSLVCNVKTSATGDYITRAFAIYGGELYSQTDDCLFQGRVAVEYGTLRGGTFKSSVEARTDTSRVLHIYGGTFEDYVGYAVYDSGAAMGGFLGENKRAMMDIHGGLFKGMVRITLRTKNDAPQIYGGLFIYRKKALEIFFSTYSFGMKESFALAFAEGVKVYYTKTDLSVKLLALEGSDKISGRFSACGSGWEANFGYFAVQTVREVTNTLVNHVDTLVNGTSVGVDAVVSGQASTSYAVKFIWDALPKELTDIGYSLKAVIRPVSPSGSSTVVTPSVDADGRLSYTVQVNSTAAVTYKTSMDLYLDFGGGFSDSTAVSNTFQINISKPDTSVALTSLSATVSGLEHFAFLIDAEVSSGDSAKYSASVNIVPLIWAGDATIFDPCETVRIIVSFTPSTGYKINSTSIPVKINGKTATYYETSAGAYKYYIDYYFPIYILRDIEFSFDSPVVGKYPASSVQIANSGDLPYSNYILDSVYWADNGTDGNGWIEMDGTEAFKAGHYYYCQVYIDLKNTDDYEYCYPVSGFKAIINGKTYNGNSPELEINASTGTLTATFNYYIDSSETANVSGTVKSCGSSESDQTLLWLYENGDIAGEPAYETSVTGTGKKTFGFVNVAEGTYTLRLMKKNHVTREYTVTVGSSPVTLDTQICLTGDVNGSGKVDSTDYIMLKRTVLGTYTLADYPRACADINGDGKVNSTDYIMLKRAVLGTYSIFED